MLYIYHKCYEPNDIYIYIYITSAMNQMIYIYIYIYMCVFCWGLGFLHFRGSNIPGSNDAYGGLLRTRPYLKTGCLLCGPISRPGACYAVLFFRRKPVHVLLIFYKKNRIGAWLASPVQSFAPRAPVLFGTRRFDPDLELVGLHGNHSTARHWTRVACSVQIIWVRESSTTCHQSSCAKSGPMSRKLTEALVQLPVHPDLSKRPTQIKETVNGTFDDLYSTGH